MKCASKYQGFLVSITLDEERLYQPILQEH